MLDMMRIGMSTLCGLGDLPLLGCQLWCARKVLGVPGLPAIEGMAKPNGLYKSFWIRRRKERRQEAGLSGVLIRRFCARSSN